MTRQNMVLFPAKEKRNKANQTDTQQRRRGFGTQRGRRMWVRLPNQIRFPRSLYFPHNRGELKNDRKRGRRR